MASTSTETAAAALRNAVEERWNRGDLDGFLEIFAADAELRPHAGYPDLGPVIRGRDALHEFFGRICAPTEFQQIEQRGSTVIATFSWAEAAPAGAEGDWTLTYRFRGGQAVEARYFRSADEADRALAADAERLPQLTAPTLCAAFQATATHNADRPAIRLAGDALTWTWREYAERVERLATGLAGRGVRGGDTVGLMLTNRPEFHVADAAAMHLGAIPVSIYNTSPTGQIEHIVEHSQMQFVISEAQFAGVLAEVLPAERLILVDDAPAGLEGALSLDEVAATDAPDFDFEARWRAVEGADILALIYTSGTTGPPKGVQLTHDNILADWEGLHRVLDIAHSGRIVSWMPAAHIADRLLVQYQQIVFGHTVTCCPDAKQLVATLPDVRPTFWVAVPRVWEKLASALQAQIADDDEQQAAIELGLRKVAAEQAGHAIDRELHADWERADAEVYSGIRAGVGLDDAEIHISGAAPLTPEVSQFFHAIGMPFNEVWGMSELPIATCSTAAEVRIGTVGKAVAGVELRLADDGEVLLRGPQVFGGYHRDAEKTAESLDDDGWLHTGDIGSLDEDGYLRLIDRKKELIVNAAGKNMSPANIEARLKSSTPLVGQVVCIGDRRSYNVALVVLDPDGAAAYARREQLGDISVAQLASDDAVQRSVASALAEANQHLSRIEQIKRFALLPEEWQPGGDELTPSQKLKRKPIAEKYARVIDALYDDDSAEIAVLEVGSER